MPLMIAKSRPESSNRWSEGSISAGPVAVVHFLMDEAKTEGSFLADKYLWFYAAMELRRALWHESGSYKKGANGGSTGVPVPSGMQLGRYQLRPRP